MAVNPLMNLIPSVGMGLNQSYSTGGSVNSGNSAGWSQSGTNAMDARSWSEAQSALAWNRDMSAMDKVMAFNAAEAQKQRDWQERMANTVYTRSVANMREAGINPILAANMGLSGANVGSGATASIGGAPSAPVAQNFMDSWSASQNASESHGSSWSSSEGGLITALEGLGRLIGSALNNVTTGMNLNLNFEGLREIFGEGNPITNIGEAIVRGTEDLNESREAGRGTYRNGTYWDRESPAQRNQQLGRALLNAFDSN